MIRRTKRLSDRADEDVIEEFDEMIDESIRNGWNDRLNCHDRPEDFALYRVSPPQEVAVEMCAGCPMMALAGGNVPLCAEYAWVKHPAWTILGGVVWSEGKPFVSTIQPLATKLAA